MLRVYLRYGLIFPILLALLIGVSILIGLQQPPSAWASLLRLSDCQLPCWVGITPGQTSLADAQQRIQAVYGHNPLYRLDGEVASFTITYQPGGQWISVILNVSDDKPPVVERIDIWLDVALTTPAVFAELYSSLDDPESVTLTSIGGQPLLVIFQHQQQVAVVIDAAQCNKVLPIQKVYIIDMSAQPLDDYFSPLSPLFLWRGFQRCYEVEPGDFP